MDLFFSAPGSEADPGDGGQHRQVEARHRGEGGADGVGAHAAGGAVRAPGGGAVPRRRAVPAHRGGDGDQRVRGAVGGAPGAITGLTQGM